MGLTVTAKEMREFLNSKGFWIERTTKHHIMTNGAISVPISKHDKEELKPGTLNGILDSTKISKKDLKKWLGRE